MAAPSSKSTSNQGTKRRLKIWFFFVAIFMLWASYTLFDQLGKQEAAAAKLSEVELKIESATKQMNDLKLQVDRLNDPEYIQQVARKEHNMIMPGEQSIHVAE
ncbi:septum formation initiator family protein [Paenibacillus aurantiacus]|uniref:Septum formation initiator family protein n=1 Tax=Paenibacillus aurantiacus TaxID=1936118 RepID=A0ABV5KGJ6_9BACL